MNINWYGQSCFQINSSQNKNSNLNIVIDPFSEDIGLKVPKLEADILLITHNHHDHNNLKAVQGDYFLINGPGEYEIKNAYIKAISSFHDSSFGKERGDNIIYTIEVEDLKICHLGDFGQKELTAEQVEKIGRVDILMIPIGGIYTISGKEAVRVMTQIEPNITIPMHYQLPKLKLSSNQKLESLESFLKTMGIREVESTVKLSIKKKNILSEEAKVVVLIP